MGSLALQASLPLDMAPSGDFLASELSDADYLAEVLRLTTEQSETNVDNELAAKAAALGISIARPSSHDQPNGSLAAESEITVTNNGHVRSLSAGSHGSSSTAVTSHSSTQAVSNADSASNAASRVRSKSLNFSQYDKYLAQLEPNLNQPKFVTITPSESAPSIFSVSTRRSYVSIKNGLKTKIRWKRKSSTPPGATQSVGRADQQLSRLVANSLSSSCICCRDDFNKKRDLQTLPCGHSYCVDCLHVMASQAINDESKMPPRCCTQPIPSTTVKTILTREEQHAFLKSVLQFSTPWESRMFCPNTNCNEFIPPRSKIDPKHPFDVVCRKCKTRVCIMCKRNAHEVGHDCPDDWELDAVLKMGEKSGWRRCYKCRTLVELTQGCTHMTCRCKAQFCYICGAVWDPAVGCPNFCNGEEELERRRVEEAAREAEQEAEKAASEAAAIAEELDRIEATERTRESEDFKRLRDEQEDEMQRFRAFETKTKWLMWARHTEKKLLLVDKFNNQVEKMKERHVKTTQQLEDRQIAAEMELRTTLEQSERSVRIRLRHMEAYCDGLGRHPDGEQRARVVTERDLRELGQQYNLRDNMERLNQAKINVMRDRQAQAMEELLERQEDELQRLEAKRDEDIENLGTEFANEEDVLLRVFKERKNKLQRRWLLAIDILRVELEKKNGLKYGEMATPEWPVDTPEPQEENLAPVEE